MKKFALIALTAFALSSCATLFTSSKETITVTGMEGTRIFDAKSNMMLAEIGSSKTAILSLKKKMDDKQLLAKKEGYKVTPLLIESSFNAVSLWNILFWPGFIVDLATGQMNKYDTPMLNVNMEKE